MANRTHGHRSMGMEMLEKPTVRMHGWHADAHGYGHRDGYGCCRGPHAIQQTRSEREREETKSAPLNLPPAPPPPAIATLLKYSLLHTTPSSFHLVLPLLILFAATCSACLLFLFLFCAFYTDLTVQETKPVGNFLFLQRRGPWTFVGALNLCGFCEWDVFVLIGDIFMISGCGYSCRLVVCFGVRSRARRVCLFSVSVCWCSVRFSIGRPLLVVIVFVFVVLFVCVKSSVY